MFAKVIGPCCIGFLLMGCADPERPTSSGQEFLDIFAACDDDELCGLTTLLTLSMNRASEEPIDSEIKIRDAETDGQTITVNFDVPFSIVDEPPRNGLTSKQQFAENYRDGICDSEGFQRLFEVGGEVRVVSFLPSGEKFSDGVISSC